MPKEKKERSSQILRKEGRIRRQSVEKQTETKYKRKKVKQKKRNALYSHHSPLAKTVEALSVPLVARDHELLVLGLLYEAEGAQIRAVVAVLGTVDLDAEVGGQKLAQLGVQPLDQARYARHAAAQVDALGHLAPQVDARRLDGAMHQLVNALAVDAPQLRLEQTLDRLEARRLRDRHFSVKCSA